MISTRLIALGIGYMLGIVCATLLRTDSTPFKIVFFTFLIGGGLTAAWALYREFNWKENHIALRIFPLLIASFCAGNIVTNNFLFSENPAVIFFDGIPDKGRVELQGIIAAEPETRSDRRLDLRLRVGKFRKNGETNWTTLDDKVDVKISVSYPLNDDDKIATVAKIADSDAYGYLVELSGLYQKSSPPLNPGGFDYETFLLAEGFVAAVEVFDRSSIENDYLKIIEESRGNLLVEAALEAKENFISTIQRTIPPPESFFVSGAVLGTRFSIKGQEFKGKLIEDSFRHSGVGHVLAVSGLHVSVVSLLLFSLLRLTRINPKYFTPFLILLLFLFAFLTGARPSSLRATIMNSLVIAFYVYGGGGLSRSAYAGLAFSAFLILLSRPMALYSAGFLLSFGAVLSLVMLTNPFDRLLRTLRGARLFAAIIFFALCIYLICARWEFFLQWETLSLLAILFFVLIYLGNLLNRLFPALAVVNPDKLPAALRIFLSAQLGIQFGMLIPLSSFFFAQMPVAGVFINLLAIPLIGVIVQLGLLGGIFGAIPFIGEYIALVIGATNYIVAKFFIWLAYFGSEILPFPVTPIPSIKWLIIYYILIAIFASSVIWIRKLQNMFFVIHKRSPFLASKLLPLSAAAALFIIAVLRFYSPKIQSAEMHILAGASNPVICITRSDHRRGATLIGGGHPFFARSALKTFLLKKGNIFVEDIFIAGHSPEYGTAAAAALTPDMRSQNIFYPNFHEPVSGDKFPIFDSMESYFDAIGEPRIHKSALEGKRWAKNYYDSYANFAKKLGDRTRVFNPPVSFKLDNRVEIEYLRPVFRSRSIPIRIKFENKEILLLSDIASTKRMPKGKLKTDILVLAGPSRANLRTYLENLKYVLRDTKPEIMILCVSASFADKNTIEIVNKASELASQKVEKFIRTDLSGAVSFNISNNNLSSTIKTHLPYEF